MVLAGVTLLDSQGVTVLVVTHGGEVLGGARGGG